MKSMFAETLLVSFLPLLLKIADVASVVVIIGGGASTIWVIIQIVWRLKNWNKDK